MPVEDVRDAAARFGVEPGAPATAVRDAWRRFLQETRPDLGWLDGAALAGKVAERELLTAVARQGSAARRGWGSGLRPPVRPGPRLRPPASPPQHGTDEPDPPPPTWGPGEPEPAAPTGAAEPVPDPGPAQPSERVRRAGAHYLAATRADPAPGGRVDVEL